MIIHIDPLLGSAANPGTEAAPRQYLSDAPPGASLRFRAGRVHPIAGYRFMPSGSSIDRYGEGPDPVLRKTVGGDAWIYVQNASRVVLRNFAVDCAGLKGAGIALSAGKGHVIEDALLAGIEVYGSPNHVGIEIAGNQGGRVRNVRLDRCRVHHCANHGFRCSTDVARVSYTHCESHDNGFGIGAHGFTAWGPSPSSAPQFIVWIKCRAYRTVDFDGIEGQGFQSDDNSADCAMLECESFDNHGAGFAVNNARNATIAWCAAYRNGGAGVAVSNNAPAPRILYNRLADNMRIKTGYAAINLSGASPKAVISDNTIQGSSAQRALYCATPAYSDERNVLIGIAP